MDITIPTTDNWQDQLEYIATKEGFNFTIDENGDITLQKFSPRRQDFTIELMKTLYYSDTLDDLKAQLASYDVNEQTMAWYGANRGEPRDLQDLLDDMKWCKNELQELTDAVNHRYGFTPADYFNEAVMEDALATTFEEMGLADRSFSTDMQEILLDHMSKYDNPLTGLEEISTHGCVSGILSDFVYYSDTKEFYTKHIDDIEDFIYDLEDDLGDSISLDHPRYNSAVWLVAEQCASLASDSLEENIQNTLEAWSEDLTKEQVEAFLEGNSNELIADHLEETLSFLGEDLEDEQDARLDANSEELDSSMSVAENRCVLVSTNDLNSNNVPDLGELSKVSKVNCPSYNLKEYEGKFISLDVVYTSVYANKGIIDYTSKPSNELDDVVYYLLLSIRDPKQIEQLADNMCKEYPLSRLDKQELIPLLDAIAKGDDRNAVVALGKYVSDTEQKVANEIVDKIKKQYGYKELPLQSEAPRIVVPSSPVQEQAQAILDARGGEVKSTQKQEEESQVNKSSLKI